MAEARRPKFMELLLTTMIDDYRDIGWRAFAPSVMLVCAAVAVLVSLLIPNPFGIKKEITTILAAILTAQGIILAISLSSGQQIYSSISTVGFSSFLRKEGILNHYLICIVIMEITGIISILVLLTSIGILLFEVPENYLRASVGISLFTFLYSIRWIAGGSLMVRDLIYYRSLFDEAQQNSGDHQIVSLPNHRANGN